MKKMSKLAALLMVALMIFMLVPASALAMEEDVFGEEGIQIETSLAEVVEPVVEEPLVEEALVEEAVVEEAVVEEPVVEEPVVEEPVVEEPVVEEPVVEEAIAETAVVVTEEPIAEVAATAYLALIKGGMMINVLADNVGDGYSFDAASSTLTLTDFTGEQLLARVFGEAFSLILHGKNVLGTDTGFAVDIDGDLHLSGTGELIAAGSAIAGDMGGGIRALGDIVVDGGTYYLRGLADENTGSAVGIMAGNNDGTTITPGELIIKDGVFDIMVIDTGDAGAYGTYSYGDQIIRDGWFDIYTYSDSGMSVGMGAWEDLVFRCGYVDALAVTDTGEATGLYAWDWVIIDGGVFDLVTYGGEDPRAIRGLNGVYLDPCYGDVDLTASELHLSCGYTTYDPMRASAENPKTGVETLPMEVLLASLSLLALIGLAVVVRKQEFQK